jgi:hypothetical protein
VLLRAVSGSTTIELYAMCCYSRGTLSGNPQLQSSIAAAAVQAVRGRSPSGAIHALTTTVGLVI